MRCELHKCTTGHYKLFIYKKIVKLFYICKIIFIILLVADFVCWSSRLWRIHIFTICLNTSTNGTTKTDTYERKSNFVLLSLQIDKQDFRLEYRWQFEICRTWELHFIILSSIGMHLPFQRQTFFVVSLGSKMFKSSFREICYVTNKLLILCC